MTLTSEVSKLKKKLTIHFKNTMIVMMIMGLINAGCDKSARSYSLMAQSQSFQQASSSQAVNKIDVLWVVDNSASMQTSQANLANNFASFIQQFQTLGFDYHMAVTTTDAYLANSFFNNANSNYSATAAQFRDGFTGTYGQGTSGVFVMNPQNTTASVFQKNMSEGTSGSGDERAFSSFVQALSDPTNVASGFRRSDAFLSIIILSDEDDFSGDASFCDHFQPSCATNYVGDHNFSVSAPELQPVSYFVSWLDTYVGNHSMYSVSTLYTDSASCLTTLNQNAPNSSRIIAQRYPQIASLTSGVAGSLCGNFASTLATVSQSVVELASSFTLKSAANPSTIVVLVNGSIVPNNTTNGWTYNSTNNSILFHGTAVPPSGANISVTYTPASGLNN